MKKRFLISILILLGALISLHTASNDIWADERICTECHTDDTGTALKPKEELEGKEIEGIIDLHKTFRHSSTFMEKHRTYASQSDRLCLACHKTSFCTDCHAYKDELKPSLKYSDRPDRSLPHRGDYIFQHRIDGKIDPTPCFRCHGRQNNKGCKVCHK